jgi:beta-N-acetylhexosaminidase
MTVSRLCSLFILLSFVLVAPKVSAQNIRVLTNARAQWVDSMYNVLNDTERIGQLFMIAAYSGGKDYNENKVTPLVVANKIGGLIFMQGTPEAQAVQNNKYQSLSKVPLLIGMDAEWGLGMRLTGVKDLPRQVMIGATHDTALAYLMGVTVAAQAKRLGVHINFAPVVDVNNNPDNPIINARSFGENKVWVADLGIAYMKGMQDNGLMACAKHFPGHGDTKTDSHKDLPVISKTLAQLDTLELYPFRRLINAGVQSVMVAHLDIPALETEPHIPTTLSKNTITNLLKTKMGFRGLVFTDALNMEGITKYFQPGDVDVRALLAGNDMLLFSQDVPVAIAKIQQAVADGKITAAELEQKVKKILEAKYDVGLSNYKPINTTNITADINKATDIVRVKMAEAGVTLIRDKNKILDKLQDKNKKIGYVGVNASSPTVLYNDLDEVVDSLQAGWLPKGSSSATAKNMEDKMRGNDIIIIGVHNLSFYPGSSGNHGLDNTQMAFLKNMAPQKNVFIAMMGNAYLFKNLCDVNSAIVAYEDDSITQSVVADIMLSLVSAKGKLPVTPCPGMKSEQRIIPVKTIVEAPVRDLKPTFFAEDAGVIKPDVLDKLSMFLQRAIVAKAFPGCRVLASKNGKVFYDESFGYLEYDKKERVTNNTIYDLASVTKVVSTTLAVMRLYETGKLNLDKKVGDYLPWTKGTDKAGLAIRDLLMHQAGLKSWIPFYKETLDEKGQCSTELYKNTKDTKYSIEVAKNLYLRNDYRDTVWKRVLESPLENKGKYVYSDLDYYFLAAIVEQVTGQHIDKYVEEQFYRPMGLKSITYNPLQRFKESDIAPTEQESIFRCRLIRGYVHDPGAALFGGIAGHAGVFSTAGDVGAIFQMLMNGGSYSGKQFFKKTTVEKFTAYNSRISRRALGFDKPSAERDDAGPAGNRTSGYAFGHQGFTGTCAWADPATGVVFVFLSNRVNPSAENNGINKQSVRTTVQDYIYESLGLPIVHNREEVRRKQLATTH